MRRRRSKSAERALLAFALLLVARRASAQACCFATGAATPARLGPAENLAVGTLATGQTSVGTFDAHGHFATLRAGSRDVALEQDLFATVRVLERVQLTATVPFLETFRSAGGVTARGGGLGDVRAGVRWDVVDAGAIRPWPDIALLASVTAPTGRPLEHAGDPLGAGATGTGATQIATGLALERVSGPWLATATTMVTFRTARDVGGASIALAPRSTSSVVGAWVATSGVAVAASIGYAVEPRASLDGVVIAGSARRSLTTMLGLQLPLGRPGRLVVAATATPPLPIVDAGETAALGLSLAWIAPLH